MQPHRLVLAAAVFALAACATSPSPPGSSEASTAKRAAGGGNTDPLRIFRAFGTEPFWNVAVENTTLTFTTPDDPAGIVMRGERRPADDGVEIRGTNDGKAFALVVRMGDCGDGMSDNRYAMVATFRYGDAGYTGCGEAAK